MSETEADSVRSFVAIDLPEEIRKGLLAVQRDLEKAQAPVKWVKGDALHLTLKFLGSISGSLVAPLRDALAAAAAPCRPFPLFLEGAGSFPPGGNPRVVWVAVKASEDLSRIQRAVEEACVRLGCEPEDRPFAPHLTLGRVKVPPKAGSLRKRLLELKDTSFGSFTAGSITLYQSVLLPSGPRYTALAECRLTGGS